MSDPLGLDAVAQLAKDADIPRASDLLSAIARGGGAITAHRPVRASEALKTYRVRLQLWNDGLIGPSVGLPEIVDALERAGDESVRFADYKDEGQHFVVILSERLEDLLAVAEVPRRARPGGDR
jgi:hypothetical protein